MFRKIKNLHITPGCVSCGSCEVICKEVFELKGVAQVKEDVDYTKYDALVREAAEMCPVTAIKFDE